MNSQIQPTASGRFWLDSRQTPLSYRQDIPLSKSFGKPINVRVLFRELPSQTLRQTPYGAFRH